MKKYLMTGVAALAICAAFTSCSKSDELYDQGVVDGQIKESVNEQYAAAFEKAFGKVGPNVDWGFGSGAGTRGLSDKTAGADKNRGLWAATDDNYNLLVPTPLTSDQRLRVRAYFQAHPNLSWQAPTMTNYFVQQVYKGNPTTKGAYSDEEYPQGNGNTVKSSDHMNKLTVGTSNEHVLDFNNGDNPNNAKDVKDNGTKRNDQAYHSDQITLIIGIQPTCVGFHVTEGDVQHNECMALAGAKEIDDWAKENKATLEAAGLFGEDVWYGTDQYGYANSSWNRSFVGLDYEQLTLEQCYATDWQTHEQLFVKVDDSQGNYIYKGKDADNKDIIISKTAYKAQYGDDFLRDLNGNKIPYITDQTNNVCGTNIDFPNQDSYQPRMDCTSAGGGNNDQVLDLTAIQGKLNQNAYPAWNGGLLKWVKDIGGRDYVYSDWIVTLTPAQENEISTTPTYRVIAEDLNAGEKTDFDFNDVVFDVEPIDAGHAKLVLQACGGIYKLTVADVEVHGLYGKVPDEKGLYPMINTHDGPSDLGPKTIVESYAGDFSTDAKIRATIKAIPIVVWKPKANDPKDTLPYTIEANTGQPAAKVLVDKNFGIVNEHQSIADQYGKFTDYVQGRFDGDFWWKY
jgi:hypothetical protein